MAITTLSGNLFFCYFLLFIIYYLLFIIYYFFIIFLSLFHRYFIIINLLLLLFIIYLFKYSTFWRNVWISAIKTLRPILCSSCNSQSFLFN